MAGGSVKITPPPGIARLLKKSPGVSFGKTFQYVVSHMTCKPGIGNRLTVFPLL